MTKIIHISDTHIGQPNAKDRLARICRDIRYRFEPGEVVVVHTGDITDRGTARQVADAEAALGELGRHRLLVVRGNHDVGNGISFSLAAERRTRGLVDRLNGFETRRGAGWRWDDPNGPLSVVGINTAENQTLLARGSVGYTQLLWVADTCTDATTQGRLVVAVAHHTPEGGDASLRLEDGAELYHTLSHRCSMLLVGHLHSAMEWSGLYGLDRVYAACKTTGTMRYRVITHSGGVWRDSWVEIQK